MMRMGTHPFIWPVSTATTGVPLCSWTSKLIFMQGMGKREGKEEGADRERGGRGDRRGEEANNGGLPVISY